MNRSLVAVLCGLLMACGRLVDEPAAADPIEDSMTDVDVPEVTLSSDTAAEDAEPDAIDPPPGSSCLRARPIDSSGPTGTVPDGFFLHAPYGRDGQVAFLDRASNWSPKGGWTNSEEDSFETDKYFSSQHAGGDWIATLGGLEAFGALRRARMIDPGRASAEHPSASFYWRQPGISKWRFGGSLIPPHSDSPIEPMLLLLMPGASKWRVLAIRDGVPVVYDRTAETETPLTGIAGWMPLTGSPFVRFTAVGKYYVRSGQGLPLGVIDLDALSMKPVESIAPIEDWGAIARAGSGGKLWVYGRTAAGKRLYLVDPASATAESFGADGLVEAATPPDAQDLLAEDGATIWKLRFGLGDVAASRFDTATGEAEVVKVFGDLASAEDIYSRPRRYEYPEEFITYDNGLFPPENLAAFRIGPGDLAVFRKYGPLRGVRLTVESCP